MNKLNKIMNKLIITEVFSQKLCCQTEKLKIFELIWSKFEFRAVAAQNSITYSLLSIKVNKEKIKFQC